MVWFDVLLIILIAVILVLLIIFNTYMIVKDMFDIGTMIGSIFIAVMFIGIIMIPTIVIDTHSGYTVGEITSVDKNTFGSTAVYVKTTNNKEEKYCVETDEKAKEAAELIGKKVKISYGKRVGIYSVSKCDQAPIDRFEEVE